MSRNRVLGDVLKKKFTQLHLPSLLPENCFLLELQLSEIWDYSHYATAVLELFLEIVPKRFLGGYVHCGTTWHMLMGAYLL